MENNKKAEIKTDLHAMNKMLMTQLPELEEKRKNELSWEQSGRLQTLILSGLSLKTIESNDIVLEDGEIAYINGLEFNDGEYTVERNIPFNKLEKQSEIKGTCCTHVWDKWIKVYDKSTLSALKK